jgi:hypothetical protein
LTVRRAIGILFIGLLFAVHIPAAASAAVRVIEGEVIFTLRAPEAKRVFLAGDFNNWNPEVEEMVKEGDTFEWSLFLVAGKYHYRFVVDGQWVNDPDNPPEDPQLGSPLVLVETEQGLRIKEVDDEGRPLGASFEPSARYIGRFIYENESLDAGQRIDVNIKVNDKKYSATAVFRSADDSWELSPLRSDIFLDRGHVETQVWKCRLTAFENDTIWTSSDPFTLAGPRGVYRYNAGYGKRGLSLDIPLTGSLVCRALFADKLEEHSAASVFEADGLRGIENGSAGGDSTSYTYRLGDEDSDVWVVEALLHLGDYRAGFVHRIDRGLHPGLLRTMQPLDGLFENAVYRTDERSSTGVTVPSPLRTPPWGSISPRTRRNGMRAVRYRTAGGWRVHWIFTGHRSTAGWVRIMGGSSSGRNFSRSRRRRCCTAILRRRTGGTVGPARCKSSISTRTTGMHRRPFISFHRSEITGCAGETASYPKRLWRWTKNRFPYSG